jgi:YD repeat-containing protein
MKKITILFLSTLVLSFTSCKKDETTTNNNNNNNTGTPTCRVKTELTDDGTLSTYYYDAQGRVTKYTENDGTDSTETIYTYTGNVVSMNDGSGSVQMAYLNAAGLADSMVYKMPPLVEVTNRVKYNSAGLPVEYVASGTVFGTEIQQVITMEYVNGNISKMTANDGTNETITNYTYFLDKANKLQSFTKASQFMYDNTHMVKSMISDDNTSFNYTYEFDTDGKVTKTTETDEKAATTVTIYSWLCN